MKILSALGEISSYLVNPFPTARGSFSLLPMSEALYCTLPDHPHTFKLHHAVTRYRGKQILLKFSPMERGKEYPRVVPFPSEPSVAD